MNERIKQIIEECGFHIAYYNPKATNKEIEFLAQQIAKECYNSCMELAAKCAGLPGNGVLAVDCANLIKEDFDL